MLRQSSGLASWSSGALGCAPQLGGITDWLLCLGEVAGCALWFTGWTPWLGRVYFCFVSQKAPWNVGEAGCLPWAFFPALEKVDPLWEYESLWEGQCGQSETTLTFLMPLFLFCAPKGCFILILGFWDFYKVILVWITASQYFYMGTSYSSIFLLSFDAMSLSVEFSTSPGAGVFLIQRC